MRNVSRLLSTLFCCGLLLACSAVQNTKPPEPVHEALEQTSPATPEPTIDHSTTDVETATKPGDNAATEPATPQWQPLETETLFKLLSAELAAQRQQPDIALANYLHEAKRLRNPQLAERATLIARYLKDTPAFVEATTLWIELEPNDTQAQLYRAMAAVEQSAWQLAFNLLSDLAQQQQGSYFDTLANAMDQQGAENLAPMLTQYQELLTSLPADASLRLGTAVLQYKTGQLDDALANAIEASRLNPDNLQSTALAAQILSDTQRGEEALHLIENFLELHPDNRKLRLHFARMLTRQDLSGAATQFSILLEEHPNDPELRYSLALTYFELNEDAAAEPLLQSLLDSGDYIDGANFFLGQIYLRQNQPSTAAPFFIAVSADSQYYTNAISDYLIAMQAQGTLASGIDTVLDNIPKHPQHATALYLISADSLIGSELLEEAKNLLDHAIIQTPDDAALRYNRAMLFERTGDIAAMEQDFRQILQQQPNNATVLNALGYTLANNDNKIKEALTLIEQALQIRPEDPAILDSMGWVLFKQHRYEAALPYLEKAYSLLPDEEVAAHLGETLWQLGRRAEAIVIWQNALQKQPDGATLLKTMQRLNPPPRDNQP